MDGGAGSDTAKYLIAVDANLATGRADDTLGIDTLVSIANLTGSDAADKLVGDGANNTLDGRGGADVLTGSDGNDILKGGNNGDTLDGGNGADVVNGDSGNDKLTGGPGADTLDGGNGADTAVYAQAITADLTAGTASDGDTLANLEHLTGSAYDDNLTGNSGANTLSGGGGGDTLQGLAGDDTLLGNGGQDILIAGSGVDTCDGGPGTEDACLADCETRIACE